MDYLLMEPGIITGITFVLSGIGLLCVAVAFKVAYSVTHNLLEDVEGIVTAFRSKKSRAAEQEIEF